MRAHTRVRALLFAALGAALLAPVAGSADAKPARDLTFMSYNLYLGSSLDPALGVPSLPPAQQPAAFVAAVAQIYGTAVFTDFPTRAGAIADIIAADEPDVIGLQEVTNWVAQATPGSSATPRSYDFLAILMAELASRGLDYEVAGVSQNADIGPAPLVAPNFGCVAVQPVPSCVVTLQDRDVILVNDDTPGLHWRNAQSGTYSAQQSIPLPGGPPVSFGRGWVTIDGKYRGREFHVANTHLEVSGFAAVQEAQAQEFLAGPAKGPGADIALGDFNSAADGSTTDSYDILTSWFRDAWAVNPGDPGSTSGQNQTLTNPVSQLARRIDFVFLHGAVGTVEAHVVGDEPFRSQTVPPRPIWPSDHAGVVATLRLR